MRLDQRAVAIAEIRPVRPHPEEAVMPVLTLPGVNQVANWVARQADGVTPSAAITLAQDNSTVTPSGSGQSVSISVATGASAHIARCTMLAQNLTDFDELRLTLRSSRPSATPFIVELRLGSAALAIGTPGNTWHRRLPLTGSNRWDLVRLSLDDLPAAVRGALTVMQLHVLDDALSFRLYVDDFCAVRPRMVADTEKALVDRLDAKFGLNGSPVPALPAVAGAALPATRPCIAIQSLALRLALERATGQAQRCDHVVDGYRLRPAPATYEIGFALEPLAASRADQAAITDWLLSVLPAQGTLRVGGQALSLEQMEFTPLRHDLQPTQVPRQWLAWRAFAWQETGAAASVRPAEDLLTQVDWKEAGGA